MSRIALISCAKSKKSAATKAALLYDSPLFRKSLLYALSNADACYILSAKHRLIALDEVIEPYELTMKNLTRQQKTEWGRDVVARLRTLSKPRDELIFLCGNEYYKPIISEVKLAGCTIRLPLGDLPFGKRLQRLIQLNSEDLLFRTYSEFYGVLRALYSGQGGGRLLRECNGKLAWPKRGLYFFLEPEEKLSSRMYFPLEQRVTRVGTHAVSKEAKSTLWSRLSTHRGGSDGMGSHRSSIFRLHVGAALAGRNPELRSQSWGLGSVATEDVRRSEAAVEREVSQFLGETRVLWLDIPDDASPRSDRAYLERNAIGLLSRYGVLRGEASDAWLGRFSSNINIALSGLWNLNHLYSEPNCHFIEVLTAYVEASIGKRPTPTGSIAPASWYSAKVQTDSDQLKFAFDGASAASAKS
jgi:hypothetical protein